MSEAGAVEITVSIGEERRDALLSAMRRGDADETRVLLIAWRPHATLWDEFGRRTYSTGHRHRTLELSDWVRRECLLHVAGGRFQHALALLDRYLLLPQAFSRAEDRARESGMS